METVDALVIYVDIYFVISMWAVKTQMFSVL